jgi:hypothetical protein
MKFRFIFVLSVMLFPLATAHGAIPHPELRGCIKIQGSCGAIPRFRVLFDGKETISNSEGFYALPLEEQVEKKYFLLICPCIKQSFEKSNTIKSEHIVSNASRRFFIFQKNAWTGGWEVQETTLEDNAIPLHCVVVLLDPIYVDTVESWGAALPNSVTKVPLIVLKNSVDSKKLEQASAASLLGSLELMPFHEPIKETGKRNESNQKVVLALVQ